eukprot:scaffold7183_cov60-Phaeocystis_antarctica.AAC.3
MPEEQPRSTIAPPSGTTAPSEVSASSKAPRNASSPSAPASGKLRAPTAPGRAYAGLEAHLQMVGSQVRVAATHAKRSLPRGRPPSTGCPIRRRGRVLGSSRARSHPPAPGRGAPMGRALRATQAHPSRARRFSRPS